MAFLKTNKAKVVQTVDPKTWELIKEGNLQKVSMEAKAIYKCSACVKEFGTQEELNSHLATHSN